MKKSSILLSIVIAIISPAFAQKTGIGTNNPSNTLEVVSTVNAPATASILATNNGTTGNAVMATSNASNTIAVIGSSTNGLGVQGYSNSNVAISGYAFSGTALSATSSTGYAMQVSGNLKFSGGNTTPSEGAVLTSDAAGNATWRKSNVAFLGLGTVTTPFAAGVFNKVEFTDQSYDLQNNFEIYNGGVTPSSSVFTAPAAGVYHFSSNISFAASSPTIITHAQIKLVKNSSVIATFIGHPYTFSGNLSVVELQIAGDFHLSINDKVWIVAAQYADDNSAAGLGTANSSARFSGHLIVTD